MAMMVNDGYSDDGAISCEMDDGDDDDDGIDGYSDDDVVTC